MRRLPRKTLRLNAQLDRGEGVPGDAARVRLQRAQGRLAVRATARMNGYILSPEAEDDIFEIWSYLAKEVGAGFGQVWSVQSFDYHPKPPGSLHRLVAPIGRNRWQNQGRTSIGGVEEPVVIDPEVKMQEA